MYRTRALVSSTSHARANGPSMDSSHDSPISPFLLFPSPPRYAASPNSRPTRSWHRPSCIEATRPLCEWPRAVHITAFAWPRAVPGQRYWRITVLIRTRFGIVRAPYVYFHSPSLPPPITFPRSCSIHAIVPFNASTIPFPHPHAIRPS